MKSKVSPDCPHPNFTFADISMYQTTSGQYIHIIPLVQFILCATCHQAVPNPHTIERFRLLTRNEVDGIKRYFEEKGWGVDLLLNERF